MEKGLLCGSSLILEHHSSRDMIGPYLVYFLQGIESLVLIVGLGTPFGTHQVDCLILLLSPQNCEGEFIVNFKLDF